MKYAIKSHETGYSGVTFRSRLEARWAAMFDLIGWQWEYEPVDLIGWTPDFRVSFPCGHSECGEKHTLLVEVKPYFDVKEFKGHPCMDYIYGCKYIGDEEPARIPADASACFGVNPTITEWEMCHGAGGGRYDLSGWVHGDLDRMWNTAGKIVRYEIDKH